jgi:DNA-binding CsgD family transcriptional regulator
VARLRAATDDHPERSLVWRELLSHLGIGDVVSTAQRDRFGCWGFLDLWRTGADAAFGEEEAGFLADVTQAVTPALRKGVADSMVARPGPTEPSGPAVMLLSPDLEVRGQTPPTAGYLRSILPTPLGVDPVPAVAYNVSAQLLAREAGVDDNPAWARVVLDGDGLATVRADRLAQSGVDADIAVSIEPASASERLDLFVRAFGLTAREVQLLTALSTGADTRELARTMAVSEHTVQDHLKSIFAKTSARSRTQLLAWIRGG